MNKIKLLTFFLVIIMNPRVFSQDVMADSCTLLQNILKQKHIGKILGIDKPENGNISIRVTDLTATCKDCSGYYNLIPYFVVNAISPNLNTGRYRDVVITQVKHLEDSFLADIYCASFACHGNNNTNYHLEMEFRIQSDGSIVLIKESIGEWHDGSPNIDYNSIKN